MRTYDCILSASKTRIAFLKFPFDSSMIFSATSEGRWNFSFLAMFFSTVVIYETQ